MNYISKIEQIFVIIFVTFCLAFLILDKITQRKSRDTIFFLVYFFVFFVAVLCGAQEKISLDTRFPEANHTFCLGCVPSET